MQKHKKIVFAGMAGFMALLLGIYLKNHSMRQEASSPQREIATSAHATDKAQGLNEMIAKIESINQGITTPEANEDLSLEAVSPEEKSVYEAKLEQVKKLNDQFRNLSETKDKLIQQGMLDSEDLSEIEEKLANLAPELVDANEALLEAYKQYSEAYLKKAAELVKN